MAQSKQTRGKCVFCQREMTRGGLTRHLSACKERKAAISAADQKPGRRETLYHLLVRDAWSGSYWLHLEINGSAILDELDDYLRAIWLECCGHLSMFSVGGWSGDEISKQRRALQVFSSDIELTHIYDFGTSSHTLIRSVGVRKGRPLAEHPIYLMARNDPFEVSCSLCSRPATSFCTDCWYEQDEPAFFCDEHAEEHEHEEYLMPWVNSPRVGLCGYDGPAEPPY
jgi:hypothetical protein